MVRANNGFRYDGRIFDAHSHIADLEALNVLLSIAKSYGVSRFLAIVHDKDIVDLERKHPHTFVFAKFYLAPDILANTPEAMLKRLQDAAAEGYRVAKMHFAPFWIDRSKELPEHPSVDSEQFDRFFGMLADERIPVLIHVSDPDTYYATRYTDTKWYGTKDEHLAQFEKRLAKSSSVQFQVAHFCAQPEQDRLANLGRMFDHYPNLFVDTGSARWMARELGKDVQRSRRFIETYSDRILLGSDCVARGNDRMYYEGRYQTLRLLLESDVRAYPLPFTDSDTVNSGGTQINGLSLPLAVLKKIYWENAVRIYHLDD